MKKKLEIGHFLIGKSRGFIGQISCGKLITIMILKIFLLKSVLIRIMSVLKVETDIITSMAMILLVMQLKHSKLTLLF
jgi:hypothetical protein